MIILPSAYFGSTEYWSAIRQGGDNVVIDLGENYVKRSERNRTEIMTSGGVMQLSVHIQHANRPRQPMRDIKIDYSKRWQHQHWIALVSAYKRTPYFDYYADFFRSFYEQETRFLVDFNEKFHQVISSLMMNNVHPTILQNPAQPYTALHHTSDWQGLDLESCFGNGQSILDLLFEYGPETIMKI